MPFYKDANDAIYQLDDESFIDYLPLGCVEINKNEANLLLIKQRLSSSLYIASASQVRIAMLQRGMLNAVESAIENMQGEAGEVARITWKHSGELQSNSPLFTQLADSLGLSQQQIDDLFAFAVTL